MRRLLQSRGARKFRRSRMAMSAFWVILGYVAVAVLVWVCEAAAWMGGAEFDYEESAFGQFVTARTAQRVGPDSLPGVGGSANWERRSQQAEFWLERLERALDKEDAETAVAELHFAERRVKDGTLDELGEELDLGWELFDEMDELVDAVDESYDELDDFVDARTDAGIALDAPTEEGEPDHAALLAAVADGEELVEAKVDEILAHVDTLFPHPAGGAGFAYWLRTSLGTDRQGRSIAMRALYSVKTAMQVGVVTALISVIVGSILGAAAALYGGWIDHLVIWLYSTFSSVPNLVLLSVLSFMFSGSAVDGTMIPLYTAFCLTFWIGPCRVIRGEALKIKELEYVQAATAVGFGRFRILLRHVLPNTSHLIFINFSLLFIAAVKSEVILTFLGLGLKDGASWGIMISQSKAEVITGNFWQIGAATAFMFVLVLAFNVLTDALQDAFDPKHVS
jgi:peptide/nickel transport system permease protein